MENQEIKQNIIITILLQTINNFAEVNLIKKQTDIIVILKDTLNNVNSLFENDTVFYEDLTPEQANQEINKLDELYKILSGLFNLLVSIDNQKEIKTEYNLLIDNLENLREGIELYQDEDFINAVESTSKGDYSDFIRVA